MKELAEQPAVVARFISYSDAGNSKLRERVHAVQMIADPVSMDNDYGLAAPILRQITDSPHHLANSFIQFLFWLSRRCALYFGNDEAFFFRIVSDNVGVAFQIRKAVQAAPIMPSADSHIQLPERFSYTRGIYLHLLLPFNGVRRMPYAASAPFFGWINIDAHAPAVLRSAVAFDELQFDTRLKHRRIPSHVSKAPIFEQKTLLRIS